MLCDTHTNHFYSPGGSIIITAAVCAVPELLLVICGLFVKILLHVLKGL